MSTDTDEAVDVDVDVDQAVPCRADDCDNEATWRITSVHRLDHMACENSFSCDLHRRMVLEQVARLELVGLKVACLRHMREIDFRWMHL